jgi:hypothetical protein
MTSDGPRAPPNAEELARIIAAAAPGYELEPELNDGLPDEASTARDPAAPELTLFVNANGALTKQFTLDADGKLVKTEGGQMAVGMAMRLAIDNVQALADLIGTMSSNQALALGSMPACLPAQVSVTTKKALNGRTAPDNTITRSREYLTFDEGRRGFCLCDFDRKGITAEVQDKLTQSGSLVAALATVIPELKNTGHVVRASTSAGLFRTDTGLSFADSGGIHLYIQTKDVSDSKRFLETLHDRCWLAGLGWYWVGKAGQLLERSIVDIAVATPEHLCFEGPPPLGPLLAQDKAAREPKVVSGDWLDTRGACPPLTLLEQNEIKRLKAEARQRLAGDAAKARAIYIEAQAKKLVTRTGMSEKAARQAVERQCRGVLPPDIELPFDNPELAGRTVADVIADPPRFAGETLADPLEGVDYGRCKAMIMCYPDGWPWIHSFAHGRTIYELRYDAAYVRKMVEAAGKEEVVATFVRLAVRADLDPVELSELRQLAHKRSGHGLKVIDAMLKPAQLAVEQSDKAARAPAVSPRLDPRPRVRVPLDNDPWWPVLTTLDEVLGKVATDRPPARDIENNLTRVRQLRIPHMHAFNQAEANCDDPEAEKLPPPEQWSLAKMSEIDAALMIEKHIDFYTETKDGGQRSVQLPLQFVRAYLKLDNGALPTVVTIATAPIVLPDGKLLAPEGLDRDRGIQFIIPPELRAVIPQSQDCTPERVKEAMVFLCNEWLVDVATDYIGKAAIVSLALTMVERSLLDQRPAYNLTAGRRGGGKTTTATMAITAVTGQEVAGAAWSKNVEERRKALMSYFMSGTAYILWDNLERGARIACTHIEQSCTASYYADRKLGVTEAIATAASVIHVFTGCCIAMKGELVSPSTFPSSPIAQTRKTGSLHTRSRSNGQQTIAARSWPRST